MKIIFFGSSRFVLPLIEMLSNNFDLALVVSTETDVKDAVPAYCTDKNIPFKSVKEFDISVISALQKYNARVGVLAYFGVILPKELLEIFPDGILNIHPSLLPHYRGPTPVQSAILNGDKETGVTIIRLDDKMDHGPILAQVKEPLRPDDSTSTLHARLFTKGTQMLKEIIPDYLSGKIKPENQNESEVSFTKKDFTRQDGFFNADNPPQKDQLDRMIRAYFPWPTAWTNLTINGKEKIVKFLPGKMLQVEGGRPMSVKDFLNGYPNLRNLLNRLL